MDLSSLRNTINNKHWFSPILIIAKGESFIQIIKKASENGNMAS